MALPRQRNWGCVTWWYGADILSEEEAAVRTCRSLGVRRRYRCVIPGTEVVRCEHRGSSGKKALGITAIHRGGSGRKRLLFPPRLTKRRTRQIQIRSIRILPRGYRAPAAFATFAGITTSSGWVHAGLPSLNSNFFIVIRTWFLSTATSR